MSPSSSVLCLTVAGSRPVGVVSDFLRFPSAGFLIDIGRTSTGTTVGSIGESWLLCLSFGGTIGLGDLRADVVPGGSYIENSDVECLWNATIA
jgi:hypothetical protein